MNLRPLSVIVGTGVLLAGMAIPAGAAGATSVTKSCGPIGFPQSDVGAFNIRATNTSCAMAGAVAVGSKGKAGASYWTLHYRCPKAVPSQHSPGGMRFFKYRCTGPGQARVTFEATW